MKHFRFSLRSKTSLLFVHEDLKRLAHRALELSEIDFVVIEGIRKIERQRELYKIGATRTLNSRHLTGHAIDVAAWSGGEIRWDWPLYKKIAAAFKAAAAELNIPIKWGGDWRTFKDGPHFELDRRYYP